MKKIRLLVTTPIHGAIVAKGETIDLNEIEARLLVTTHRAEYVEPKAPVDYKKKKKGPDENRMLEPSENRGKE